MKRELELSLPRTGWWAGAVLLWVAAQSGAAEHTFYGGFYSGIPGFIEGPWQRPDGDQLVPARHESTEFFVSESGIYSFEHETVGGSVPRYLYFYSGEFDASEPRRGLMLSVDGSASPDILRAEIYLVANVRYEFVASTVGVPSELDPVRFVELRMHVSGPGAIHQNLCTFTDDIEGDHLDFGLEEAGFVFGAGGNGSICAWVRWGGPDGMERSARASVQRSRESATFHFFSASNPEVHLKVLDGCAINGHYWVFASSSTDLPFVLSLSSDGRDLLDLSSPNVEIPPQEQPVLRYEFAGGPSPPVVDLASILCSRPGGALENTER